MSETSLFAPAADHDPRQSAFFRDNLAAFREHAPHLYARLAQVETLHSHLFVDDDGAIDIKLGNQRFYGADAVSYTQAQLDAYFAAPERRYIGNLGFKNTVGLEGDYEAALAAAVADEGVELDDRRVDQSSQFTVVFGLGLGLHLEPLRDFTRCAELIVVEPNFDNLYHSLFVTDWRALFDRAAQSRCTIHIVTEKDQGAIALHLRKLIRLGNPALTDGLYVYQHYGSSLLMAVRQAFHREFALHIMGLGFFADELTMMANAVGNLKQSKVRILAAQQQPRPEPVFICGSGPSIDGDLEVIAAQRDRAIVVSIGSSLRTLLAHGIRPDFHVETENHPLNAANVARAADEFGVGGITLLGATTVQPAVTELFDEVVLYFRESQSPAEVFCNGIEKMGSAGPSVANAALVTLSFMGFREIYLFGVDMGSRSAEKYHSAETYIGLGESEEWAGASRTPAPANFGGKAVVETILSWSRSGLEDVLKANPVIRCVNCSDGVRIAGAIPMLPTVLDLKTPPLDHAAVMDDVRAKMPAFPMEVLMRFWREADLAGASEEVFAGIDAILAAAAERDDPGLDWLSELYDSLDAIRARCPALGIFLYGTTCLCVGGFWWFDGRIADAGARRRVRRTAVAELRQVYGQIERRLSALLQDVEDCLAGRSATVDSDLNL